MITIRDLIDANLKALANKTLGAFLFRSIRYDYQNGCHRCAIGVVLGDEKVAEVVGSGCNAAALSKLIISGLVQVEDEVLFQNTQLLHDRWAMGARFERIQKTGYPAEIEAFLDEHSGEKVDSQTFTDWINLLDRMYPALREEERVAA